jgi:hypothetical protein
VVDVSSGAVLVVEVSSGALLVVDVDKLLEVVIVLAAGCSPAR